ncbi:hypothetical protein BDR03DRAFT_1010728 [Suillus americanus]|nr:hypothetical protein BDR03DRAFT_1010728 [Suillus americanus]
MYSFCDLHVLSTSVSRKNPEVPSERTPAGIFVPVNLDETTPEINYPSTIIQVIYGVGCIVAISLNVSLELSLKSVSFSKLCRMRALDLSLPPVRGGQPSLTLKPAVVHAYRNREGGLLDSVIEHDINRCTDSGQSRQAQHLQAVQLHSTPSRASA